MALVTRTITNIGDPLCESDGTPLQGKKVIFTLVDSDDRPTDAWDVLSGERVAPIREEVLTASTGPLGTFSINLWPNDRGDKPTFYRCEVDVKGVQSFTASLPSGVGALQWIDFKANGSALSSDVYSTPLIITEGDTLPVKGVIVGDDGLPLPSGLSGYTIALDVTSSGTVSLSVVITDVTACAYSIDLSSLTTGRYSARMVITNAGGTVTGQSFVIEVLP